MLYRLYSIGVVFICIKIFYDFTTLFNDLKVFNHYAAMVKNNYAAIIFYDQVEIQHLYLTRKRPHAGVRST